MFNVLMFNHPSAATFTTYSGFIAHVCNFVWSSVGDWIGHLLITTADGYVHSSFVGAHWIHSYAGIALQCRPCMAYGPGSLAIRGFGSLSIRCASQVHMIRDT